MACVWLTDMRVFFFLSEMEYFWREGGREIIGEGVHFD